MSDPAPRWRPPRGLVMLWSGGAAFVAGLALIAAAVSGGWYAAEALPGGAVAFAARPAALGGALLTGAGFATVIASFFRRDLWRPGRQVPPSLLLLSRGVIGLVFTAVFFVGGAVMLARYRLEIDARGLRYSPGIGGTIEVPWSGVERARLVEKTVGAGWKSKRSRRLELDLKGGKPGLGVALNDYTEAQRERIVEAILGAGVTVKIERGE